MKIQNHDYNVRLNEQYLSISPMAFEIIKNEYYTDVNSDLNYSDTNGYFKQLLNDGIVIIPDFLTEKEVDSILDEISDIFKVRDNAYLGSNKYSQFEEDGKCELEINDTMAFTLNILKNDLINNIAKAYHGINTRLTTTVALLKYGVLCRDEANELHIDDWKIRLKAFYLLTDVTTNNAPLVYYKKSHLGNKWQQNQFYVKWAFPYNCGIPYYLLPELINTYNFEKIICTAKKGSIILFDGRGLHTATTLISGYRLLVEAAYSKE